MDKKLIAKTDLRRLMKEKEECSAAFKRIDSPLAKLVSII